MRIYKCLNFFPVSFFRAHIFLRLSFSLTRTYNSVEVESNPVELRCNSRSKINQPVGTHLLGKFPASRELCSPYLSKTLRRVRHGFSSRIYANAMNVFCHEIVWRFQDEIIGFQVFLFCSKHTSGFDIYIYIHCRDIISYSKEKYLCSFFYFLINKRVIKIVKI